MMQNTEQKRGEKAMPENERDFKGVWIPKTVWLDTRLNALEKIILTEIDSLDMSDKGCYASNKYIAEFCQCSETKVSTAISKLIDYGYLWLQSFDGRQRVLKSRLSNFERQDVNKCNSAFENVQESNTYKNTKNNTEKKEIYKSVLDRLNEKAGTNYRASSKATQSHINARFAEGYTLEDFFSVIDKKCAEWRGGEMEKYLRPETLFGSKFENYLNAPATRRQTIGASGIAVDQNAVDDLAGIF
jgi:uncharacterized phage protein (TIGR02220 family)